MTLRRTLERLARVPAVRVALAYAATLGVLFHASLFGGDALTQADALYLFEPWKSVAPEGFRAANELLLDQATGFLPWNHFAAEQLRLGELPLWSPHNYAGIPLVGTCQSAVYWPLNTLFYVWPSWHAYAWMAFVLLWSAGMFTFLFLRRLGLRSGAAAVGGLGFMLCGFLVVWLNHPHSHVAMFLPALLWSVERIAARPRAREAALFGLLFGVQLLGGHVQTSLHVALFVGAYALVRMRSPVDSRVLGRAGLAWIGVGGALGTLLAAPQLLPFLEYLAHSQAFSVFGRPDLVASDGVAPASIMLLDSDWYGAPHTHDYEGPLGPNLNYNELIGGYVGRILLALALFQAAWAGWRSRPRGVFLFFAAAVLVAGLVAYQIEPLYSIFKAVPGLGRTKLMRFLLFVAFGLSVLGAMGFDRLLRRLPHRAVAGATAAAFALVAAELVTFAHGYNPEVDPDILLPRTEVTDFLQRETGSHRVVGIDNTILKPNANVFYRIPMLSGYDSMEDQRLAELLLRATRTPPRFPFISQIAAFDRIEAFPLFCLLGVEYFLSRSALPEPLVQVPLDAELLVFENPQVMPKAFFARGVRVVADRAERVELMTSAGFDPRVAVLEADSEGLRLLREDPDGALAVQGDSLADATPGEESVRVLAYRPREIELRVATPRRALLVVNDLWDAGWHAVVEGRERASAVGIERVDHALRGIWIEPGEWLVRLRYDPLTTRLGLWLAFGAAVALALLARRRDRSP